MKPEPPKEPSSTLKIMPLKRRLIKNSGTAKSLFIFLPGAAVPYSAHEKIIGKINKIADVLFIESGYYGISPIDPRHPQDLSLESFRENLHQLLEKYSNYQILYFLTGSVGAIHALDYQHHYPKNIKKVFLTSPSISSQQPFFRFLGGVLLYPIIHFHFDFIFGLILKLLRFAQKKQLAATLKRVADQVGLISFALCLEEIRQFPKQNWVKNRLKDVCVVILGENDAIFNHFCDRNLCRFAPVCITLPGGHRVISDSPDEVFAVIQKEI